ncbi:MAG: YbhB/YbcL family Raf kinase inhibitor-like protein [Candidatus Saccharimonadales bacterium]
MQITSTYFQDGEPIPERFSRKGEDINPAVTFSEISPEAKSLALVIEDPDAPNGIFTHWILYNMSPGTLQITDGELPVSGQQGRNDYGDTKYGGPQPPSGTHRYFFKLFALDTMLSTDSEFKRPEFDEAIDGHVIDEVSIMGIYSANDA